MNGSLPGFLTAEETDGEHLMCREEQHSSVVAAAC